MSDDDRRVFFECEECGEEYEEHPLEMAPHLCDACTLTIIQNADGEEGEAW